MGTTSGLSWSASDPSVRVREPRGHPGLPLIVAPFVMDGAVRRGGPAVSERASRDMQTPSVHDRVRGVRMASVVQPRTAHDPSRVIRLDPEPPQVIRTQRAVSLVTREHRVPGRCFGETVQQLPRRLAEQNVPRSRLRVNRGQAVGVDLAPAQAAYLTRPTSGQEEQPHRRGADRILVLAHAQDAPYKYVRRGRRSHRKRSESTQGKVRA